MKKAVVTGGAGFIGSNMVDYLIEKGIEVTILDNFSTGKRKIVIQKQPYVK
jgi:nucleoside-diphosphate-sugar epimerase